MTKFVAWRALPGWMNHLDGSTRQAIETLAASGLLHRAVARKLGIERETVTRKGCYDGENLFVPEHSYQTWKFHQGPLGDCDRRIETLLETLATAQPATLPAPPQVVPPQPPDAKRPRKRLNTGPNASDVDFSQALARICGVDLIQVCGFNLLSVLMLVGEIGADKGRWRSARAFCSWLGLCPGAKISGGKVLSSRTRKVKSRASTLLRLAAWAAGKTDSWLGRFYRRVKARRGAPKAVTATARKLAAVIYNLMKYRENFIFLDPNHYEKQTLDDKINRLRKEAQKLGSNSGNINRLLKCHLKDATPLVLFRPARGISAGGGWRGW